MFQEFFTVSRLWYLYQVSGAREEVTLSPYHLIISKYLWSLSVRFSLSLCILCRLQVPSLGRWSFISCQRWQIPTITTSPVSAIIQQSLASHPANADVLGIWTKCLEAVPVLHKHLDIAWIQHLRSSHVCPGHIWVFKWIPMRFVKSRWRGGRGSIIERDLRKLVFVPNRDKRQSQANENNQWRVLF